MADDDQATQGLLARAERGAPLVATAARCATGTAALAVAVIIAVEGYVSFSHSAKTFAWCATVIVAAVVLMAALFWTNLRAEELRLARELRTARTGTAVLRGIVARRRRPGSLLTRLVSSGLGMAAVLLADGDRSDALDVLAKGSRLMGGGRLEELRSVVEADLDRATGTAAGLARCTERLRAMPRVGNREADLYATHVFVKALLEQGDADAGLELASRLAASDDDEERIYVVWLRTWFDASESDAASSWLPSEGDLRMATLLARSHGASKLVERLEARVAAIARPEERK